MGCEVLITQDEAWRRGTTVPLKQTADEALADSPTVENVLVSAPDRRRRADDRGARRLVARASPPTSPTCPPGADGQRGSALPALHVAARPRSRRGSCTRPPATSSASRRRTTTSSTSSPSRSTGARPTSAGSPATATSSTGRSATARRASCTRARPDFPDKDRWWEIVERYEVDILYTAPTAIRTHMKWGPEFAGKHDLSSLRLLGSVGEPINPEAWVWYHEHIGGERLPDRRHVVADRDGDDHDHAASGRDDDEAGLGDAARSRASTPAIYNEAGEEVGPGGGGYLVLKRPWPAMLRGIYGDDARYRETYWSKYDGRLLRRRRRADRRGRRLLAARPGRRRDERLGPSHLDDRGRVGARRPPGRRRSGRRGPQRRADRPGDRRVRDAEGRRRRIGREARGAPQPRGAEDRADRQAGEHRLHRPSCRRPAPARSCAGCSATWPRTGRSATRRRSPIRRSSTSSASADRPSSRDDG